MEREILEQYEAVIGLEVHAQLLTDTKMFCRCSAAYGDPPNTNTCPVCMGMPGALPVVNERAVEFAIRASLGLNFTINNVSQFSRKNYFYPDLTKGYQITQFDKPLAERGWLMIEDDDGRRKVNITRLHLEEDAGKSLHEGGEFTRVDYNRCGVPLIEIVSEPDIRSPFDAELYLQKLRQILVYLEVCDGNMEEGSLRCDGNISIRPHGETKLRTKTEVKNLNSFRFVRKALQHEFERQVEIIESGGAVAQETRMWDQVAGVTLPMRSKEEAHDYRYFPEPDIPLLHVSAEWIEKVRSSMPELPDAKIDRLERDYGIPRYDVAVLAAERPLADYYEAAAAEAGDNKLASNWVMGEVLRALKEKSVGIKSFPVSPESLAALLRMIGEGAVSGSAAKEVFAEMVHHPEKSPEQIIEERGLAQVSDESALRATALEVIRDNQPQYEQYKGGKTAIIGFLVGQLMKATRGAANPQAAQSILRELLDADELPES